MPEGRGGKGNPLWWMLGAATAADLLKKVTETIEVDPLVAPRDNTTVVMPHKP
jgi:hypothetical protein